MAQPHDPPARSSDLSALPGESVARPGDLLQEINELLAPELKAVETLLRQVQESDSQLIREVGEYIQLSSGKKLRPIITLLMARACGGPDTAAPVEIAAALESIHVATLIHDDVIDKARLRRGKPTVNARWGDDVAILMADFLFAAAFDLALTHLDPEPLRVICTVTRKMCEGEMFQIEQRGKRLAPEDYLQIISRKTAGLFSACAGLGAWSAANDGAQMAEASAYGLSFGFSFQITDDALDYSADDSQWGKAVGIDLASGKQTLPLILTLRQASDGDRQRLQAVLDNGRDLAPVRELMTRCGALEQTLEMAQGYAAQALAHLDRLHARHAGSLELLQGLTDYVVNRRF